MSNPYSITITMPADTVSTLQANGFALYGFKASGGPSKGGVPVVWFCTTDYSEATTVQWSEQYFAYTSSTTDLGAGEKIMASAKCLINLGQEATVTLGGVLGFTGEIPNQEAIAIQNGTTQAFTCGIAVQQGSGPTASANPTCAFPLVPGMLDEITPIEQVFLTFATQGVDTGTVLEQSFGWGALIDLTLSNAMSATYDLNAHTQWGTAPNVTPYAPSTELVPLLINPQSTAASVQKHAHQGHRRHHAGTAGR